MGAVKICLSHFKLGCYVLEFFNNLWVFQVSRSVNVCENFLAPVKFETSKSGDDRSQL